jgi:LPS export ABC transporter protein LptC
MSPSAPPNTSAKEQRKTFSFAPRTSDNEESASSITASEQRRKSIRNFILLGVFIISSAVIYALIISSEEEIKVQVVADAEQAKQLSGGLEVKGLSFKGTTEDGSDFVVLADSAREMANQPNLVQLTSPRARIDTQTGNPMTLQALKGTIYRKEGRVDLEGLVVIVRPDPGYTLMMDKVVAHLDTGLITSDRPVRGSSPRADISAGGIIISNGGQNIRFTGKSKLHVLTEGVISSDDQSGSDNDGDFDAAVITAIQGRNNAKLVPAALIAAADSIDYDITAEVIEMTGGTPVITNGQERIKAGLSIIYNHKTGEIIATGDVHAQLGGGRHLYGEVINVELNADGSGIKTVTASGNVRLQDSNNNILTGDHAEIDAISGISTLSSSTQGQRVGGVFNPDP